MEGPANYIATNKIVLLSRPPSTPKSTASWLPPEGLVLRKSEGGRRPSGDQRGRKGKNDEGSGPSPVSLFLIRKSMDRCYVDQMILSELLLTFPQARLSGFRICPFFWRGRKGFLFPPPACREGGREMVGRDPRAGPRRRNRQGRRGGKSRGQKKKREMDDEERTGRGDGGRLAVSLVRRRKGIKLTTGREGEEAQKDGGRREGIGFMNCFFRRWSLKSSCTDGIRSSSLPFFLNLNRFISSFTNRIKGIVSMKLILE